VIGAAVLLGLGFSALVIAARRDARASRRYRTRALTALGMVGTPEAEELLIRATESDDVDLQIAAAFQLAAPGRIQAHRGRLESLAESWPDDAGRDAGFIRDRLAGLPSS